MKLIVLFRHTPLGIQTVVCCQDRTTGAVLDSRNEDMFSLECHMYETGCTAKPSGRPVYIPVWFCEGVFSSPGPHRSPPYLCARALST